MEPARVRVATAANPSEAAMIRSLLAAHEIHAVVSGETHANMLGGLAGPLISLDVWVDREDAEQAAELIAGLRSGEDIEAPPDDDDDDEEERGPHVDWDIERRKRTGVVLLLSCVLTFGTGHMYARAWFRGITLAAIELVGIRQAAADSRAIALIVGAILFDLIGAMILVRRQIRDQQLPRAKVL
jgi:hypothetical protein